MIEEKENGNIVMNAGDALTWFKQCELIDSKITYDYDGDEHKHILYKFKENFYVVHYCEGILQTRWYSQEWKFIPRLVTLQETTVVKLIETTKTYVSNLGDETYKRVSVEVLDKV